MPPEGAGVPETPAAEGLGLPRYGYGWPGAFAFFGLPRVGWGTTRYLWRYLRN